MDFRALFLLLLLEGTSATGTVYFRQGSTAYHFSIPESGHPFLEATRRRELDKSAIESLITVPHDETALPSETHAQVVATKVRVRMTDLPKVETTPVKNDLGNSTDKKPRKKRPRRLPLCKNLRWPMVTSTNPIPCISDAAFIKEEQLVDSGSKGARFGRDESGPRLLPRPINPADGVPPPRPRHYWPPPSFATNYVRTSPQLGRSAWHSKPTYGANRPTASSQKQNNGWSSNVQQTGEKMPGPQNPQTPQSQRPPDQSQYPPLSPPPQQSQYPPQSPPPQQSQYPPQSPPPQQSQYPPQSPPPQQSQYPPQSPPLQSQYPPQSQDPPQSSAVEQTFPPHMSSQQTQMFPENVQQTATNTTPPFAILYPSQSFQNQTQNDQSFQQTSFPQKAQTPPFSILDPNQAFQNQFQNQEQMPAQTDEKSQTPQFPILSPTQNFPNEAETSKLQQTGQKSPTPPFAILDPSQNFQNQPQTPPFAILNPLQDFQNHSSNQGPQQSTSKLQTAPFAILDPSQNFQNQPQILQQYPQKSQTPPFSILDPSQNLKNQPQTPPFTVLDPSQNLQNQPPTPPFATLDPSQINFQNQLQTQEPQKFPQKSQMPSFQVLDPSQNFQIQQPQILPQYPQKSQTPPFAILDPSQNLKNQPQTPPFAILDPSQNFQNQPQMWNTQQSAQNRFTPPFAILDPSQNFSRGDALEQQTRELERYKKLVAVLLRRLHTQNGNVGNLLPQLLPRPLPPLQIAQGIGITWNRPVTTAQAGTATRSEGSNQGPPPGLVSGYGSSDQGQEEPISGPPNQQAQNTGTVESNYGPPPGSDSGYGPSPQGQDQEEEISAPPNQVDQGMPCSEFNGSTAPGSNYFLPNSEHNSNGPSENINKFPSTQTQSVPFPILQPGFRSGKSYDPSQSSYTYGAGYINNQEGIQRAEIYGPPSPPFNNQRQSVHREKGGHGLSNSAEVEQKHSPLSTPVGAGGWSKPLGQQPDTSYASLPSQDHDIRFQHEATTLVIPITTEESDTDEDSPVSNVEVTPTTQPTEVDASPTTVSASVVDHKGKENSTAFVPNTFTANGTTTATISESEEDNLIRSISIDELEASLGITQPPPIRG